MRSAEGEDMSEKVFNRIAAGLMDALDFVKNPMDLSSGVVVMQVQSDGTLKRISAAEMFMSSAEIRAEMDAKADRPA